MRRAGLGLAFVAAFALTACDSSDDGGGGTTGTGTGTGTGGMVSGDFAAIVALGAGDDPLAIDAMTLGTDLDGLFGDGTIEPVDLEDGVTAQTLAERQRMTAGL